MSDDQLRLDALVLYRQRPGRVVELGPKKISVKDDSGISHVRPKDVTLLHPGPLRSLAELTKVQGEVKAAWELLAGGETTLAELADLVYGEFSPATAWAAWELVSDGLYFTGGPDLIIVRSVEAVGAELAARAAKAAAEAAWNGFAARAGRKSFLPEDAAYLEDVAALAWGQREQSRTLSRLGKSETPAAAHEFLLELGYWTETVNPHPVRLQMPLVDPLFPVSDLPEEARRDLTHLTALAIDDEGNQDPDDAISLDGNRLWVHVADVAALVPPDSATDLEARARGANLYLPEQTVHMLPPGLTATLGLGLSELSPALSIAIDLGEEGEQIGVELVPSWVKVTRLSYAEADTRLEEPLLAALLTVADRLQARRLAAGAVELELPEVKIRVVDGEITIQRLPSLRSRFLVREAMLAAGVAVARYAAEHAIPMLYTVQDAPDVEDVTVLQGAATMAEMFAARKFMKPGRQRLDAGVHAGLGLECYVQVTSPLRRYLDLVAHQQIRAHLAGVAPLDAEALAARLTAFRAVVGAVRQSERLSNAHWTMAYLRRHPDWQGEGVIMERRGARSVVMVPELALDAEVYVQRELAPDSEVELALVGVDLPQLEAKFRLVS